MGVRDVLTTSFSLIVAGGVVALILVELWFYPAVRTRVDERLVALTLRLENAVYREVGQALAQLTDLTAEYTKARRTESTTTSRGGTRYKDRAGRDQEKEDGPAAKKNADVYGLSGLDCAEVSWDGVTKDPFPTFRNCLLSGASAGSDVAAPVAHPSTYDYPHFRMAYWIDEEGEQIGKWTMRSDPTPLVNVRTRDYFRSPYAGRALETSEADRARHRGRRRLLPAGGAIPDHR